MIQRLELLLVVLANCKSLLVLDFITLFRLDEPVFACLTFLFCFAWFWLVANLSIAYLFFALNTYIYQEIMLKIV